MEWLMISLATKKEDSRVIYDPRDHNILIWVNPLDCTLNSSLTFKSKKKQRESETQIKILEKPLFQKSKSLHQD